MISDIRLVFFNFFQFFQKSSTYYSKAEKLLSIFEGVFNELSTSKRSIALEKKRKSTFSSPKSKKKKISISIQKFYEELPSPIESIEWLDPIGFKSDVNLYEYQKVFHLIFNKRIQLQK